MLPPIFTLGLKFYLDIDYVLEYLKMTYNLFILVFFSVSNFYLF